MMFKDVSALAQFLWPFFGGWDEGGRIYTLSRPGHIFLDTMALLELQRLLPSWIVVEPSGPKSIHRNALFVGAFPLFLGHQKGYRSQPVFSIGLEYLRDRAEMIETRCCFRFGGNPRALINTVTGEAFVPCLSPRGYWQTDYGVVRRLYLPHARTVTVEGVHSLGSESAARQLSHPGLMEPAWSVVKEIMESGDFDESAPIEIFVQGIYIKEHNWESYDPSAVQVTPLAIVYNRFWIYRFGSSKGWVDQRPFDTRVVLRAGDVPRTVQGEIEDMPRLEVVAGPEGFDDRTAKLCRHILTSPLAAHRADQSALLSLLKAVTAASDSFQIVMVKESKFGRVERIKVPLKDTDPRRFKKKFLIHLIFARLLGLQVARDAAALRNYFRDFKTELSDTDLESYFTDQVRGKFQRDLPELIDQSGESKWRVVPEYSRKRKTFSITPIGLPIIIKLRFK